jgi:hypothetical protein
MTMQAHNDHAAIVACHPFSARSESYLRLTTDGAVVWQADPSSATSFASMREATRAALRLPGALRAFALPRHVELVLAQAAA